MVTGLPPNTALGAHVHTGRCGLDPLASGGHYQHPGTTGALGTARCGWTWSPTSGDAR